MQGYFDPNSRAKQYGRSAGIAAGAATLFGAIMFRERIGVLAEKTGAYLLNNNLIRDGFHRAAEGLFVGLDRTQTVLEKYVGNNTKFERHFRSQAYSARRDFDEYSRAKLTASSALYEQDVAQSLRNLPGWSKDKVDVLLSHAGLVKSIAGRGDESEWRSIIDESAKFRAHLAEEAKNNSAEYEDVLDATVESLRNAELPKRAPNDDPNSLTDSLRDLYRDRLRRISTKTSAFEQLTGVRTKELSAEEVARLKAELGADDAAIDYTRLGRSTANATFIGPSGKEYNFSALRSMALSTKDYLSDRVQIPLAPFQTGLSLGQLFPFIARDGDRPLAAISKQDFESGELQVLFDSKTVDIDLSTRETSVSKIEYHGLKPSKGFLREMIENQRAAAEQGAFEGSILHQAMHGPSSFLKGFGREPGSIPYWDAPAAFGRKYTAKDYLPNVLRRASRHSLENEDDILALSGVLRSSGLEITDDELSRYAEDLAHQTDHDIDLIRAYDKDEKPDHFGRMHPRIDPSVHAVLTSFKGTEGSEFSRAASAFDDISKMYDHQYGSSPKVRRMLRDMENMGEGDRERYMARTASYEQSRRNPTLLGLDITKGSQRVTNLDILKSEMFQDLLKSSVEARPGFGLEDTARRLAQRRDMKASFVVQSHIFDQRLAEHGRGATEFINGYLESPEQKHLRGFLEQASREKYNVLDLHPKTPAKRRDFAEQQTVMLMRKTRNPKRDGFLNWKRNWRAMTDPGSIQNQELTPGAVNAYWAMSRLHTAFSELGIGLPAAWRTTPIRLAAGMVLGRYLPIFVGIPELHKIFNRVTRDVSILNFLNPDMHRANLLNAYGRQVHRGHARLKMIDLIPGADFYMDSRNQEDERRHQRSAGFTPVRKGRWWVFGSREAFFGDHISYYAPSAARIARSDWQAASNVQRNNWRYWLHFGGYLNPTNWGSGAYWRERALAKDNPVLESGPAFDPDHPWSAPLNFAFGWLLKPRKLYHREFLPKRLGGTLENQPTETRTTSPFFGRLKRFGLWWLGGHKELTGRPGTEQAPGQIPYQGGRRRSSKRDRLQSGYTLNIPRPTRIKDAANDPLLDRINAYRRIRNRNKLTPENEHGVSPEEAAYLRSINLDSGFTKSMYHAQEIGGLYGWFVGLTVPKVAAPYGSVEVVNASRVYGAERRFYDQEIGGLGGAIADTLRRFLPHRRRATQEYDPVRNSMPSWLPGETYMKDFKHGSPYLKIPLGELRLPGEAYERTHPGTRSGMYRLRASSIGKTQAEIQSYLLKKEGDGTSSSAAEEGTKIHRILQKRWRALGILESDEIEVYDQELNVSGHIDAILRLPTKRGSFERTVVDIKTKSAERFDAIRRSGKPEDENLDQLLFYLHTTKIRKGLLTYVDREDVNRVFQIEVKFDRSRFNKVRQRLRRARQYVSDMVDRGEAGRGELYSPLSKFEILSDVAPYSAEFAKMQHWATTSKDSLSHEEQKRLEDAQTRVQKLKQGFELHPYRFRRMNLSSRVVKIDKFLDREHFQDTSGQTYALAGIKASTEQGSDTDEWWQRATGLHQGSGVRVTYDRNDRRKIQEGKVVKVSVTTPGRNINHRLIYNRQAEEDHTDFSSAGKLVRFTANERILGRIFETIAHLDTPVNTKFLPARSGLEEYERTDVYGKKSGSWDSPVSSYIWPTLASFTNKHPLAAAALGASLGRMFAQYSGNQKSLMLGGAAIGAVLSVFGYAYKLTGKPFIPRAVKRRRALDTYYDTLTYLKYRRLAEQEAQLAQGSEGVNVDAIEAHDANVADDQKQYLKGLRATKQSLLDKAKSLQRRAALPFIPDQTARRLRNEVIGLQQEAAVTERESKRISQEDRYPVGPHALQALLYRQRYRATVRGGLEGGSWEAALSGLPKRSRSAIMDVVTNGNEQEKRKLYRLLPEDQKALLGYALGVKESEIPKLPSLVQYFKSHPLPHKKWQGWQSDISLDMVKARDVDRRRGLDPMDFGIFPNMMHQATQGSPESLIPLPEKQQVTRIGVNTVQREIQDMLAGYGLVGVKVDVTDQPGGDQDGHEADVSINVSHRREHAIFNRFKRTHSFKN